VPRKPTPGGKRNGTPVDLWSVRKWCEPNLIPHTSFGFSVVVCTMHKNEITVLS
jgi:hypothetical protein